MPDPTPRALALAEVTAMEKPGWSNEDWPRVLLVAERAIDAYVRYGVRVAMGANEAANRDEA